MITESASAKIVCFVSKLATIELKDIQTFTPSRLAKQRFMQLSLCVEVKREHRFRRYPSPLPVKYLYWFILVNC